MRDRLGLLLRLARRLAVLAPLGAFAAACEDEGFGPPPPGETDLPAGVQGGMVSTSGSVPESTTTAGSGVFDTDESGETGFATSSTTVTSGVSTSPTTTTGGVSTSPTTGVSTSPTTTGTSDATGGDDADLPMFRESPAPAAPGL